VNAVTAHQRQQSSALSQAAASTSAALGELQVFLLRRLATQLKSEGSPIGHTLPLDASADQLEASVRETRRLMRHRPIGGDQPADRSAPPIRS
jgi:hypothetical protein